MSFAQTAKNLPINQPMSTKNKRIVFYDFFCGAGGVTEGARRAFQKKKVDVQITAINHWKVAIATHSKNHPEAIHMCTGVDEINAGALHKPGEVDIVWLSPECIFFSRARGGKPINDQKRATAWCVTRFAEAWLPSIIYVENVPEFEDWGPLILRRMKVKIKVPKYPFKQWAAKYAKKPLKQTREYWKKNCPRIPKTVQRDCFVPDPAHKGEIFHAWVTCLESMGYQVDWRVFNCADYGTPTTRCRLIVQAVRGRRKILWPEPTHAPAEQIKTGDLFSTMKAYRATRECIEWDDVGKSIFDRKKSLAPKTLERIAIGLNKFCGLPFIVPQQTSGQARSVKDPAPSITTTARGIGLAQPFLIKMKGTSKTASVDDPSPTIGASGKHLGLAQPFLIGTGYTRANGSYVYSQDDPCPVITTNPNLGIVSAYLVQTAHGNGGDEKGNQRRVRSVDEPIPAINGNRGDWAVVRPVIMAIDHKGGKGDKVSPGATHIDQPLSAITTKQRHALIQPFLIKYYGNMECSSVDKPLGTLTAKERFGLVRPIIEMKGEQYYLEIMFRMLNEREIALCQGFPKEYEFTGNKTDIVKQIGNAVPPQLVEALMETALSQV
jgi:DNA (cytosine-5)-methyltransferase 1